MLRILMIVLFVALILWGAHHFFLWAEQRGWIFYRHRKPNRSGAGDAFLEIESLVRPAARHEIEVRQEEIAVDEESGEPPNPDR
jgi:hypothetical protein